MGLVALSIKFIEGLDASDEAAIEISGDDELHLRLGAPPAETATEGIDYHVVQPGETLSDIAAQRLGDARLASDLAQLNGLSDPNKLKPGQRLRLH